MEEKEIRFEPAAAAAATTSEGHGYRLVEWLVNAGDEIYPEQALAVYEVEGQGPGMRRTLHSSLEGVVQSLVVSTHEPLEVGQPVMIAQVCSHAVQFHGMCSICFKDLSEQHFNRLDTKLTTFSLIHSEPNLKVTREEAERDAHKTARHLLGNKKLSLVLDLDQTLVHATNDLTVEALFATDKPPEQQTPKEEGEASASTNKEEASVAATPLPPNNRKSQLIDHLYSFQLKYAPHPFYIKLRPFLLEFLREVDQLFELHIYTMGTRPYANKVAELIDPTRSLFRNNILSRDECQNMNFKNLQRLFPCDDSMVIIIDDRVDVWGTCKNLIPITPYLFFHDTKVNALPQDQQTAKDGGAPSNSRKRKQKETTEGSKDKELQEQKSEKEKTKEEEATLNNEEAQTETEPDKKRAKVTTSDPASDTSSSSSDLPPSSSTLSPSTEAQLQQAQQSQLPYRQGALTDNYLLHVLRLLKQVHQMFYAEDTGREEEEKEKLDERQQTLSKRDVKYCLYLARRNILHGVHVLFSGIFPLRTTPHRTALWLVAEAFGAKCYTEFHDDLTHLVAAQDGTVKVRKARGHYPNVKIVNIEWLIDSFTSFQRPDETLYPISTPTEEEASLARDGRLSREQLRLLQELYTCYVEGVEDLLRKHEPEKLQRQQEERRLLEEREEEKHKTKEEEGKEEGEERDEFLESILGSDADEDEDEDEVEEEEEEEEREPEEKRKEVVAEGEDEFAKLLEDELLSSFADLDDL